MMLKLKFIQNLAILDTTNNGLDTIIFDTKEVLRNHRFEIFRILWNKTGHITAKFK